VLEGEYEFLNDDGRTMRVGKGSLVYVPKGTLHTYKNIDDKPGRMLVSQTPGGLHERFFEEIGELATDESRLVSEGSVDIEKIAVIAAEYGIEIPLISDRWVGGTRRHGKEDTTLRSGEKPPRTENHSIMKGITIKCSH
jgi:hypothetical protein